MLEPSFQSGLTAVPCLWFFELQILTSERTVLLFSRNLVFLWSLHLMEELRQKLSQCPRHSVCLTGWVRKFVDVLFRGSVLWHEFVHAVNHKVLPFKAAHGHKSLWPLWASCRTMCSLLVCAALWLLTPFLFLFIFAQHWMNVSPLARFTFLFQCAQLWLRLKKTKKEEKFLPLLCMKKLIYESIWEYANPCFFYWYMLVNILAFSESSFLT